MFAFSFGVVVWPPSFTQFWMWIKWRANKFMVSVWLVCWAIWQTRNTICFEEKKLKSPTQIICLIRSLLMYWSRLQKEEVASWWSMVQRSWSRWPYSSISKVKEGMMNVISWSSSQGASKDGIWKASFGSWARPVCRNSRSRLVNKSFCLALVARRLVFGLCLCFCCLRKVGSSTCRLSEPWVFSSVGKIC